LPVGHFSLGKRRLHVFRISLRDLRNLLHIHRIGTIFSVSLIDNTVLVKPLIDVKMMAI